MLWFCLEDGIYIHRKLVLLWVAVWPLVPRWLVTYLRPTKTNKRNTHPHAPHANNTKHTNEDDHDIEAVSNAQYLHLCKTPQDLQPTELMLGHSASVWAGRIDDCHRRSWSYWPVTLAGAFLKTSPSIEAATAKIIMPRPPSAPWDAPKAAYDHWKREVSRVKQFIAWGVRQTTIGVVMMHYFASREEGSGGI